MGRALWHYGEVLTMAYGEEPLAHSLKGREEEDGGDWTCHQVADCQFGIHPSLTPFTGGASLQ